MHTRSAAAVALLATGLLAGAFLYGEAVVVPTFASAPLDVHLAFRVELMRMNARVMQVLMGSAVAAAAWFAVTVEGRARALAAGAGVLAATSLLVTRFGNVPINLEIKRWVAGNLPADHEARLHVWEVFNDVRTATAVGAFLCLVLAVDVLRSSPADRVASTVAGPHRSLPRGDGG